MARVLYGPFANAAARLCRHLRSLHRDSHVIRCDRIFAQSRRRYGLLQMRKGHPSMRRFGGSLLIALTLGIAALVAQSGGSRGASAPSRTPPGRRTRAVHIQRSTRRSTRSTSRTCRRLDVAWTYPGQRERSPSTRSSSTASCTCRAQRTRSWRSMPRPARRSGRTPTRARSVARGLNYWESADRSDRRLLYLNAGHLTAINAQNGETITSFGTNGRVDLRIALVARRHATRCRRAIRVASSRT